MDRNTTIGLVLISAMLFAYFAWVAPDANKIAQQKAQEAAKVDSLKTAAAAPPVVPDSLLAKQLGGNLGSLLQGQEKEYVLENKDLKITFSSKGGRIVSVLAKNYVTYTKEPVYLIDPQATSIKLELPVGNQYADLYSFYFNQVTPGTNGGQQTLTFKAELAGGQYLQQTYSLAAEGFTVGYSVQANSVAELNTQKNILITWNQKLRNFEKDAEQNRKSSNVNYYTTEGEFDHLSESSTEPQQERLEEKLKWVALKQKFFNTALLTQGEFLNAEVASTVDLGDQVFVKNVSAKLEVPAASLAQGTQFTYFFGPNQYNICKSVAEGFQENVYLGFPVLNNLNRFVTVPVFHFLENFFSNYGLIIFLLVLIIKLALFPLSYRSYLSMAKIRVLKPELDEIKAKHGDDLQKSQADQMKLYQSVGVNPISGCIPVLLTMPVLLAIFNFFPNSIELRQESFLWADDLSTYDVFFKLPFTVPFGYGDHVSLFTILMTISTLVYTWYNNQMSAASMQGPMIAMSYVMPVVLMFALNSLPAGLSYYYLVSNVITIAQQLLIKSFVDEGAIRAKLDANRIKLAAEPQKQNRFMKRLEEAMKAQEELKKRNK